LTNGESALAGFAERLSKAWSAETASTWLPANTARGQCSVTALAAQRLLGGELLKTQTDSGPHFYNRIGGHRVDFTSAQFDSPLRYDDLPANPAEALADTSPRQLSALLRALGVES
jgi:hypothetical protein